MAASGQWAARFPLTRPVARRRARALFDLTAGFVYSQVLLACVELDLFAILAEGPADSRALAHRLALEPEALTQLLEAAEALGLTRSAAAAGRSADSAR
jgi:demethylspheroidene O-methyltransferase